MGNFTSWIRSNLVDHDRKGPTSPRVMSDPELGRASVAVRTSLELYTPGRLSLENRTHEGRNHSLPNKSIESTLTEYFSEDYAALEELKVLCAEQQRTIKKYEEQIESQQQTINLLMSEGKSSSDSVEAKPNMEEYEGKLKRTEQTIASLKSENRTLLDSVEAKPNMEEYEGTLKRMEQTIASLKSENRTLLDSVEAKPNMEEYEGTLKRMEQTIASLKSENRTLLDRLSEIGAMKLKVGNPNITDLSDCNRPEKLTEQFSELYDNIWTDSYHLLTSNGKLKDKDAVCTLLHILQAIYGICLSKSEDLNQEMNTALAKFLGQDCSSKENVDIQAFKEEMAYTIQEFRAQNCSFIPNTVKKDIKRELRVDIDESVRKLCKDYIAECSRICWNMCIKNPPMYITSETDGLFNKDVYVAYTKAGPCIAYVVWPVVYRHKNGPIMKKGVAQGKKKKSTLTKVEDNNGDHTEDIASVVVKSSNETIDSMCNVKFINKEQLDGQILKRRNSDPLSDKHPQVHDAAKGKLKSKTLETPNKTKDKPSKIPRYLKADWKLKTQAVSNEV